MPVYLNCKNKGNMLHEGSGTTHPTTQRHIPEDRSPQNNKSILIYNLSTCWCLLKFLRIFASYTGKVHCCLPPRKGSWTFKAKCCTYFLFLSSLLHVRCTLASLNMNIRCGVKRTSSWLCNFLH